MLRYCTCGQVIRVKAHWTGETIELVLLPEGDHSTPPGRVTQCPQCGKHLVPGDLDVLEPRQTNDDG